MDFKRLLSKYAWAVIVLILGAVFGLDAFLPNEEVLFDGDSSRDAAEYSFVQKGGAVQNGGAAADEENEAAESKQGARSGDELSEELLEYWSSGTFGDVTASVEYHFAKHGAEVEADTIADYAQKAADFRDEVVRDISALSDSEIAEKYIVKVSAGEIFAHKYKHREDKRYIIISDEGHLILSFGK